MRARGVLRTALRAAARCRGTPAPLRRAGSPSAGRRCSCAGAQGEHVRIAVVAVVTELFDALDLQAGVEERLEKAPERYVYGADADPDAPAADAGALEVPVGPPVAGVELGQPFVRDEARVRADEAGMDAEVHEGAAGPEDTRNLARGVAPVVDVGVRPDRDGGVERLVGERQLLGGRLHDVDAARPRET